MLRWPALLVLLSAPVVLVAAAKAQQARPGGTASKDTPARAAQGTVLGPAAPRQGDIRRTAGAPTVPAIPQPPFPKLSDDHQKYLDDILRYWEQSSSDTKRYTCKFERWHYDPVFGPQANGRNKADDKPIYKTYSKGIIKYAAPDKGLFEVQKSWHYSHEKSKPGEPKYVAAKIIDPETQKEVDEPGEKWICDGQSVFEFDHVRKKLIERQLPPEMRGQAIVDGPLPFLFGAKAEKIKERYWVRVITPADAKGEYWLEAFPKYRSDAANFKRIEIIIDEKDFLPKAIQLFDPGSTRQVFQFSDRKKNGMILDPTGIFVKDFYKPATPRGWEKVVEKFQVDEPPPKTNQAQRPAGKLK